MSPTARTGLKNAGPAWAAKQATNKPPEPEPRYLFLFYSFALSPSLMPYWFPLIDDATDAPRQRR